MNTNQDTTLQMQGQRSDNGAWENVYGTWETTPGLSTVPAAPDSADSWTFSPNTPGTGTISAVYGTDTVTTKPYHLPVIFTVGPPSRIETEIITPPGQCVAGDTIIAIVRIMNADGLVPGIWYDSVTYQNALGTGGRPVPTIDRVHMGTPVEECFRNGIDTVKFVLYYAPYRGDSLNQISANLGGLTANTSSFSMLPGGLYSLQLQNAAGAHLAGTDTLIYPNGRVTIISVGYDGFGNKIGTVNSNWSVNRTLHALTQDSMISQVYYDASNSVSSESGLVTARAPRFVNGVFADSLAADSLGIVILGPPSSLDSAVTRDVNGDGYLDEIEVFFTRPVTFLQSTAFTITCGATAFRVDSVAGVGATGAASTHFVICLHELQNGHPQTAWRPLIGISGLQGASDIVRFQTRDGAGPVIWSATEAIKNPSDRNQDVLTVVFSEPISKPDGSPFDILTSPASAFSAFRSSSASGNFLFEPDSGAFDGIPSYAEIVNDSTVEVIMSNGFEFTPDDYLAIKSAPGTIADRNGNQPDINNQRVIVNIPNYQAYVNSTSSQKKSGLCGSGFGLAFLPPIGFKIGSLVRKKNKKRLVGKRRLSTSGK
jgi:hypothetical protein